MKLLWLIAERATQAPHGFGLDDLNIHRFRFRLGNDLRSRAPMMFGPRRKNGMQMTV